MNTLLVFSVLPSRTNIQAGDIVILREDGLVPMKWPLARVTKVYPGKDGFVLVVQVKTRSSTYHRSITKIAPLLTPYEIDI